MGGTYSKDLLSPQPDWKAYVESDWRTENAKELDAVGGLQRPPIARGQSMTAKLSYLQSSLHHQSNELEAMLAKDPALARRGLIKELQRKGVIKIDSGWVGHSSVRSEERSWAMGELYKDVEAEKAKYARGPTPPKTPERDRPKSGPTPIRPGSPRNGPPVKESKENKPGNFTIYFHSSEQQQQAEAYRQRMAEFFAKHKISPRKSMVMANVPKEPESSVAAWRQRSHAARRRVIATVRAYVRWKLAVKPAARPRPRPQRSDSWSWAIPVLLGDHEIKFIDEAKAYTDMCASLDKIKASMEAVVRQQEQIAHQQQQRMSSTSSIKRHTLDSLDGLRLPSETNSTISFAESDMSTLSAQSAPPTLNLKPSEIPAVTGTGKDKDEVLAPNFNLNRRSQLLLPGRGVSRGVDMRGNPTANGGGSPPPSVTQSLDLPSGSFSAARKQTPPPASISSLASGSSTSSLPGWNSSPVPPGLTAWNSAQDVSYKMFNKSGGGPLASGASTSRLPSRSEPLRASYGSSNTGGSRPPTNPGFGTPPASAGILSNPAGFSPMTSRKASVASTSSEGTLPVVVPPALRYGGGGMKRVNHGRVSFPDSETSEQRLMQLTKRLDTEATRLQTSRNLLNMYAHRANSTWCEPMEWVSPFVYENHHMDSWQDSEQYTIYKADLVRKLRKGQIAVQVFGSEDGVLLPNGALQELWYCDPWWLVQQACPGKMPLEDRIEGVSLGGRVLILLSLAVEALAGPEAVAALTVLLHVNSEQEEDVLFDLQEHKFYGLTRENVICMVTSKIGGYRYDEAEQKFCRNDSSGYETLGSGYCMLQLSWPGEAFVLGESSAAVREYLPASVLELMEEKKIEWIMSRTPRDLALQTVDGVLDPLATAFTIYLHDKLHAACSTTVMFVDNPHQARLYDSVVLTHRPGTSDQVVGPPTPDSSSDSPPSQDDPSASTTSLPSVRSATTPLGASPRWQEAAQRSGVMELRWVEASSSRMSEKLADLRGHEHGRLTVGIGRHMWHVPSLTASMNVLSNMRIKLRCKGANVHVTMDASDLTSLAGMKTVALVSRQPVKSLFISQDCDELPALILAQDHSAKFRHMLVTSNSHAKAATAQIKVGLQNISVAGRKLLVFVCDNSASQFAIEMAINLARPGVDTIHVMMAAQTYEYIQACTTLVQKYQNMSKMRMIEATTEVVNRANGSLLACLQDVAEAHKPFLVIMGSNQVITETNQFAMGSVAMSMVRKLSFPCLIVTPNYRHSKAATSEVMGGPLRALCLIEHQNRSLMRLMLGEMLNQQRGDRVILCRADNSNAKGTYHARTSSQLLEQAYEHAQQAFRLPMSKQLLQGPMETVLPHAADAFGAHFIGIQVPAVPIHTGSISLPHHVITLVRNSRSAILIHKSNEA